ncbi:DNA phosphorothioation-dependent restriction protein DptG [Ureibacillus sp. FSL K6-8385]|uniref:DNA phosphorothioation-dependent restriction protein DptG n=1 Tax=Ureibacillus sp. FSL K6-8385 TaxID=2954684 RepID=UPI003158DECF
MHGLEDLRKSLNVKETNGKKTLKHTINKKTAFLPFQTRNPERAKFKNGFSPVLGQLFLNIAGVKSASIERDSLIRSICDTVMADDEDKPHLERIVDTFIYQSGNMRIFHPIIYKYIPLSESKESVGESEIAQYIYDSLIGENEDILSDFFAVSSSEHVLSRLIIEHLPALEKSEIKRKYSPALPFIRELFLEDLKILLTNREFFMNHINLFFAYYYFYSITQMTMKLNQFEKMDPDHPTPVYYNLDWEKTNRSRRAVTTGYKQITANARKLLTHVNTLEHLNFIFGTENKNYLELQAIFNELGQEKQAQILEDIYTWTQEYTEIVLGNNEEIRKMSTLEDAIRQLQHQLNEGLPLETRYRYALAINEIGKLYFIKSRGSLGNTLNVSQDFLILLTAVSVKKEKISLKQLFKEFERRGVFFDRYSQEEIIELFNKLNLIEKRSDSGDAQYVKPIL